MTPFGFECARARAGIAMALAAACLGAACGGGGGSAAAEPAGSVVPTAAPAPAPAPTPSTPDPTPAPTTTSGMAQALGVSASFAIEGIPSAPAATAAGTAPSVRTFYIDSQAGSDAHDGLAASAGPEHGPWLTLARLARASLLPGDTVQLACGSSWNEPLRLAASGNAALPIVVRAPAGSCSAPPTIDGSIALPTAVWTVHQGSIYKTRLEAIPMQLGPGGNATASSLPAAAWSAAHHPNRGYLAGDSTSPWLRTAADSDVTNSSNGQPVSTTLATGSDLALPAGASLVGAGLRIRTYAWWMDESEVAGVTGNLITLTRPTAYPLGVDWGYYLTGKLWMVDSPGEWLYDAATQWLYAWMPEGAPPANPVRATTMAIGIDLQGRSWVVVDGLTVRRVGVGADLRASSHVTLRNTRIEDTVDQGVDATASSAALIESNAFQRTGLDAISGWRHGLAASNGLVARDNLIRDSGVLMDGDTVLSQPRMSLAAILGGTQSTISGNTILNAGYIGILVQKNSLIEKNFVYGACSVLDDCAGIFMQYAGDNGIARGNTVVHSRGAVAGKAPNYAYTQAEGIYLDESASGILVEDNTVIDADNGILLHVASHNTVRNNRLYANRRSQIWMQATRNIENPAGDMVDNSITGNQLAAVYPGSVGLWLDTAFASTAAFGTIDGNRYYDRASPVAMLLSSSTGVRAYSFEGWRRATATDLPAGHDAQGRAISGNGYTGYSVGGASVVPNGTLASGLDGWSTWNATAPTGQLMREACPAGNCLRYVSGGSVGVISAPNFSIVRGQWYRLSIDLATEQEGQTVKLVVRRGGGGSNGYESVIDRDLAVQAGRGWKRYSLVFRATTTVNAHDPATGDLGARIDIEPLQAGQTLSLAGLELVPITPDATAQLSGTFINAGSAARAWACPYAGSQPALCGKLRSLDDDSPVQWPLSVPARSATILYAQEPALLDSDGDGIADSQDACPGTPAGQAVNASGCPLTLR